jgi:hypothetical protein
MSREAWELASWVATTVGFVLAVAGLLAVVIQLSLQRRETQLDFLNQLYAELDTHEARLAREYIYRAPSQHLRVEVLHTDEYELERRLVEDTLATFERLAYRIAQHRRPSRDAFNLYGGVLLSVANRLWPYIEDQREMRKTSRQRHRLTYRRYFEAVVREWIPRYANAAGVRVPSRKLSTREMLRQLFPELQVPAA